MSNEQQSREEEIFLEALEREAGEQRSAWLDEACAGDAELRQSVEDLLDAHHEPASFFRNTVVGIGAGSPDIGDVGGE